MNKMILEAALRYADRGWPVFPCRNKRPLTPHGYKDASTDPEQIRRWWTEYPDSEIGIPTGNRSGFLALDLDGEQGVAELEVIVKEKAEFPITPTQRTPSGGQHFLFKYPKDREVRNRVKIGGKQIDVRGEGGYIVLAPSVLPTGKGYVWEIPPYDVKLAEAPEWFLDFIINKANRPPGTTQSQEEWFDETCHELSFDTSPGVQEGRRHNTALRIAGAHLGRGETPKEVVRKGRLWAKKCDPPMDEAELVQIVSDLAMKDLSKPDAKSKQQTHSRRLLDMAQQCELFRTTGGDAFARMPVKGHWETWPVKSGKFRQWLQHLFFQQVRTSPNKESLNSAIETLEAIAIHEGPELEVFLRVAEAGGKVYIDLGNDKWEVVEIDGDGWRVLADSPVRFRRTKGLLPLPIPERGGSVGLLRNFLNIMEEDWPLLCAWLMAAFRPTGPYPILALFAEHGSAKSTTARVLRSLVDPNVAPLRGDPRSDHDLMISAHNNWLLVLDNLSAIAQWFSDALCRLSTGGGMATRKLYTDTEEIILIAQRPIILTSIVDVATRSDLLDRSLIVPLPCIPQNQRRPEWEFLIGFNKDAPKILGAMLDAVCSGLRNLPTVQVPELPRMADFAKWAIATESGLLLPPGTFLVSYNTNRKRANDFALDASPVAKAVVDFIRKEGKFEGTASEFLGRLNTFALEGVRAQTNWPRDGRYLAGVLRRIAPNLREIGFEINDRQTGGSNSRHIWTIRESTEGKETDQELGPN